MEEETKAAVARTNQQQIPPPAPHQQARKQKVQMVTGTTAMAAIIQKKPRYVEDGFCCEAYGCICDHPDGQHDVAVYNDNLARALYDAVIKPWGPSWAPEHWDQYYACVTTGLEGTPKSLLSKEEMEIMGICWSQALFINGIVDIMTGQVYAGCKNKGCRMSHDNLLTIPAKI